MRSFLRTWAAALVIGALTVGCGSGKARLEGAVTLDGQPIAEGTLQFVAGESAKAARVVVPVKDGRYAATVPVGKVRVWLSATKKTGRVIKEYSQSREEVVSIIPESYANGIEITVTGDEREHNFELKSADQAFR
jgi:hypothetical protein